MANVNSDLYDGFAAAGKLGGRVRVAMDSFELAAGDLDVNDVINLARLPADARPISLTIWNDSLATALAVSAGLISPDGAKVADEVFATALDLEATAADKDGVEFRFQNSAIDTAGQKLWEIADGDGTVTQDGNTDPSEWDIALTVTTSTTPTGGTIAFAILYTVD